MLALVAAPASAQTPFPSVAYVVGLNPSTHLAQIGHAVGGSDALDAGPDTWIVLVHRHIASSLPTRPGASISGYFVKSMRLYHPHVPSMNWNTVRGSTAPLLVVTRDQGAEVLNRADGSIAGLNLAREGRLDLFIDDPSLRIASQLPGLLLEVTTLDGVFTIPVDPFNFYDRQY